jgi:hypothetical protein
MHISKGAAKNNHWQSKARFARTFGVRRCAALSVAHLSTAPLQKCRIDPIRIFPAAARTSSEGAGQAIPLIGFSLRQVILALCFRGPILSSDEKQSIRLDRSHLPLRSSSHGR